MLLRQEALWISILFTQHCIAGVVIGRFIKYARAEQLAEREDGREQAQNNKSPKEHWRAECEFTNEVQLKALTLPRPILREATTRMEAAQQHADDKFARSTANSAQ